jgi:hypothetical protein
MDSHGRGDNLVIVEVEERSLPVRLWIIVDEDDWEAFGEFGEGDLQVWEN